VRTEKEHQESSIPGHPNILYTEIADNIASLAADKDTPIHLYCGTGRRAGVAKETLEKLGYTNVTNEGGIDSVKSRMANEGKQKSTGTPKNLLEGYR
jgi:phage shock protein E